MQLRLVEQPLLATAASFVAGILISRYSPASPNFTLLGACLLWLTCSLAIVRNTLATPAVIVLFIAVGAALARIDRASVSYTCLKVQIERGKISPVETVTLSGVLASAPEHAPDRVILEIDAERVRDRHVDRPATGRVQLYVSLNSATDRHVFESLALEYGRRVIVTCELRRPHGYRNPGVVSLRSILDQKSIDAMAFVRSPQQLSSFGGRERSVIVGALYRVRAVAISVLLQNLRQPASGLLVASLLGNHNFLDRRVAESFRAGGTFHLLVISGLHVALIASSLLMLLRSTIRGPLLRFVIVILALWAFAVMVGAQPAVTRAATMISLAVFGQLIFRRGSGANTLGASAIVLLAWKPMDLYGPGFQLSFLTVLVICLVTSPLYERIRAIGVWKPGETTPYPPRCAVLVRSIAETIFWNEREFRRDQKESRIRFRLEKSRFSRWLGILRLSWLMKNIFATTITTVGIQVALLPPMVTYFHRVSLIAPLSNVIETALLYLLMIAGVLFLVIAMLSAPICRLFAPVVDWTGDILIGYSSRFDSQPWASFRTPDYGDYCYLVYGLYLVLGLRWAFLLSRWNPLSNPNKDAPRLRGGWKKALTGGLIGSSAFLLCLVGLHPTAPRLELNRFSLTMLDVGQGDAMLLSFPSGRVMLLDSGGRPTFRREGVNAVPGFIEDRPGIGETAIAPYLWHLGIKRLDFLAATHSDLDHVQGFKDLVPAFQIGRLFGVPPAGVWDTPFPDLVLRNQAKLETLVRGDHFNIDGVDVEVLAPFPDMTSPRFSPNDRSLVLRLRYREVAFLLTGDIEKRTELRLLAAGDDLRSDVLKVAHHGSRTSTTQSFVERVRPSVALISAGNPSPFGHPHSEVMLRLEKSGARILETSRCGAITVSTDGRSVTHRTFAECH